MSQRIKEAVDQYAGHSVARDLFKSDVLTEPISIKMEHVLVTKAIGAVSLVPSTTDMAHGRHIDGSNIKAGDTVALHRGPDVWDTDHTGDDVADALAEIMFLVTHEVFEQLAIVNDDTRLNPHVNIGINQYLREVSIAMGREAARVRCDELAEFRRDQARRPVSPT